MKAILKYPGSKWSCAEWIISHMPAHRFYLETYFGSGAVFFAKPPSVYETVNDLDGRVVNFFRVVRDMPAELGRAIALTPYARDEFYAIQDNRVGGNEILTGDPVEDARRFLIRCLQGCGGKLEYRTGWKANRAPNGLYTTKRWSELPDIILEAADRLKQAQIEHTDAVELIRGHNFKDCLIYADPPYLRSVRQSRMYRHELLEEAEHIPLLEALLDHKGSVILSGYDNNLYNDCLRGWKKACKKGKSLNGSPRTETIWMNFDIPEQLEMESGKSGLP